MAWIIKLIWIFYLVIDQESGPEFDNLKTDDEDVWINEGYEVLI